MNLFELESKQVAEMAMVIALSTVLSMIKLFQMPQGGSITAASMVPIIWYGLRRGYKSGFIAGALYGVVQLLIQPIIIHPAQVILDYPLPFGLLGLSGLFKEKAKQSLVILGFSIFFAILGRFISHLISGVIFFSQYAPEGMNPLLYSLVYNGSFLSVEFLISLVAFSALWGADLIDLYK